MGVALLKKICYSATAINRKFNYISYKDNRAPSEKFRHDHNLYRTASETRIAEHGDSVGVILSLQTGRSDRLLRRPAIAETGNPRHKITPDSRRRQSARIEPHFDDGKSNENGIDR